MTETTATEQRRREPWPLALCAALLAMIAVCIGFYAVATRYPDPPVDLERAGLRPSDGYVAPRAVVPR